MVALDGAFWMLHLFFTLLSTPCLFIGWEDILKSGIDLFIFWLLFHWIFSVFVLILVQMILLGGVAFHFWVHWISWQMLRRLHLREWRLGLLCICVWKKLSLILLVHLFCLPIGSNIGSSHMMCLVRTIFFSVLQMFCIVLGFCGLKLLFQWLQMVTHYSCGFHIGVHKLIFLYFLAIYQQ